MPRKRLGNIQDRGASFRIRYTDLEGIRHNETFKTRGEAERELAIRLGELAKGLPVSSKPNTVLFGELADDVLTDYELNGFRSIDDAETRYRLHLIPVFGRRKASQITTAQIKHYTANRLREGAKPGTVNRELELMRHTFLMAKDGHKLLVVPKVPLLRENNTRSGFFMREEVDRLCSHLREPYRSFVLFGFLTGWRYSEIQGLQWRNVDFIAGEIRLDAGTTKSGESRVFPMTSELRELLTVTKAATQKTQQEMWGRNSKIVSAESMAANASVFGVGAFRKSWKTACYKAGIPGTIVEPVKRGGKPGAVKVLKAGRIFHDLRRSAARELQRQGYTDGQIMRLCGWSTRSVFDRYNVTTDADIRATMERIEAARHGPSLDRKAGQKSE